MSLTQAIDEAVEYVRAHPEQMTRAELDELERLGQKIFVLASQAGCVHALPQVPELQPQLDGDGLRPIQYQSKLNLPGDFDDYVPLDDDGLPPIQPLSGPTVEPQEQAFLVCASPRWYAEMAALRALAEAKPVADQGKQKEKTGRKSNPENDMKIAEEYSQG